MKGVDGTVGNIVPEPCLGLTVHEFGVIDVEMASRSFRFREGVLVDVDADDVTVRVF